MKRRNIVGIWLRTNPAIAVASVLLILGILIAAMTLYRSAIAAALPRGFFLADLANLESLLASLWASIVFFSIVGYAVFYFGIKDPARDAVEQRMNYLYSGTNVSSAAKDFFRSRLLKLGAYYPRVNVQLCIEEVCSDASAFRIEVAYEQVVRNCMRDEEYRDKKSYVSVTADLVPNKGELGAVKFYTVMNDDVSQPTIEFNERVILDPDNLDYAVPRELVLRADGDATIFSQHWIWCLNREGYNYWSSRFVEELRVQVQNHSGSEIAIALESKSGKIPGTRKTIEVGASVDLLDGVSMDADDSWSIKIVDKK